MCPDPLGSQDKARAPPPSDGEQLCIHPELFTNRAGRGEDIWRFLCLKHNKSCSTRNLGFQQCILFDALNAAKMEKCYRATKFDNRVEL